MKRRTASLVLALAALSASCTSETVVPASPPTIRPASAAFGSGSVTWRLVALGDSIAFGSHCPGCAPYVDLYAMALARRAGVEVDRTNWAVPGLTTGRLLDMVENDEALRSDLSHANVVTITIGVNDLPWNTANGCGAGPVEGRRGWATVTPSCLRSAAARYARMLDAVLDRIEALRAGTPTILRVTGLYDEWIGRPGAAPIARSAVARGVRVFNEAQRRVAGEHEALVADLLHGFNGPAGTADAARYLEPSHGVHPNQRGHALIARLLARLGLAPLHR